MLKSLHVKDYALIDKVDVEFGKGLNIITGETGAGKSILIDAMGLLLGERASSEVIRKDASKSIVEGIFEVASNVKVKKIIEDNDIEFSPELIVRREISLKGSNRCFVNDTPVPLSVVKELGDLLVDLHGQHEHQSLLRTETHVNFLDEFAGTENILDDYVLEFKKVRELSAKLNDLKKKESSLKEKKDFYAFQIKEIDAVSAVMGEEEQINNELKILENSEKLLELTNVLYQQMFDTENSVYDQLMQLKSSIEELQNIDNAFSEAEIEFNSVVAQVRDISEFIRKYNSKIDIDPEHLEQLRERLGAISLLKKKYGGSVESLIEYRKKIGNEFDEAANFTDNIQKLETEINIERQKAGTIAEKLSAKRKESAKKVEKEVIKVLTELGIANAKFDIKIDREIENNYLQGFVISGSKKFKADLTGIDLIEFFISTNTGEDTKPLIKVASGGEVSRIMLSLKTILAKNDKFPLLIFDEIDTGVSGRIAQKVGSALKSLAAAHQVITITHLPQIAGLGDFNFSVEKISEGKRTSSSIKKLDENEKIIEVAKLMSGEIITEASLKGARELMGLH
jgi:DNA repair protein RecN (Recombination protein N)